MEDSIKSTPIKSIQFVEPLRDANLVESNLFCSDRSTLDVINEETNTNEILKALLQIRLHELESEIQTFRTSRSQLSLLRGNYEKEYDKFCQERIALLEKIRAEYLSGVNELEEEKEKLQCEKRAFDKYI